MLFSRLVLFNDCRYLIFENIFVRQIFPLIEKDQDQIGGTDIGLRLCLTSPEDHAAMPDLNFVLPYQLAMPAESACNILKHLGGRKQQPFLPHLAPQPPIMSSGMKKNTRWIQFVQEIINFCHGRSGSWKRLV